MSQLYRIEHLHTALAQGTLILTPNRRIAEKIKQAWGKAQMDKVITPPSVYAANDWLYSLTSVQSGQARILTDIESFLLWENVVSNIDHGLLMPSSAIAELISSADDLLQQWCIDYHQLPNDPDSRLLKKCIGNFEKELTNKSSDLLAWTTNYRYHHSIVNAFVEGIITAPDTILLTGFDDLTPLLKKILTSSRSKLITAIAPTIDTSIQTTKLSDTSHELYAAASWAQKILRENKNTEASDISIGIIVPNLNNQRNEVERILQNVFEPQYIKPDIARYSPPFNISASESLAKQPIIASALQLLKLNNHKINLNDLLNILHSPFWSNYRDETIDRINAELYLRKIRWDILSINDLREGLPNTGEIVTRLNHFEKESTKQKKMLYPSDWLGIIQEQLRTLGWPGTRRLDSVEYQQVTQLQVLLDQIVSLDDLLGKVGFHHVLQKIENLCKKTPYHAQTQDSPIQVLGILEGSGLHFDAVWICGMSEQVWPPLPKPHPLLPLALQMEQNMPHCSITREQQYCETITRDLSNSAETIIVSFPDEIDESKQRISNLFSHHKQVEIKQLLSRSLLDKHPYQVNIANQKQWINEWEVIKDSHGPSFNHTKARGGQGLLKTQAQNPFDAFARYRLNAKILEEPSPGLPKTDRGVIIHAALYYFWKNCRENDIADHSALIKLQGADRYSLVNNSIEFAFRKIDHPSLFNETFRSIEKIQLAKHLNRWLEYEELRSPFKIVSLEKELAYQLNGVELSLTIDRIDQLTDGSFLLIDYKSTSGNLSPRQWLDERPDEPQLPLYSLANDKTNGISFAQINLKTLRFVAMGCHPDIPSLSEKNVLSAETWQKQLQQWESHLNQLMQEFKDGLACVDYHNGNIPEYSEALHALNRWPEKEFIDDLLRQESKK